LNKGSLISFDYPYNASEDQPTRDDTQNKNTYCYEGYAYIE